MPYVHVRYNSTDIEGVLGFKWMSSFLFALALPSVLVSGGLIIRFLATKLDNEFSNYFKLLSFMVIASGGFFFAWTFYPMTDDFSSITYYLILLTFAVGLALASKHIQNAFLASEEFTKIKIQIAISFILKNKDKLNENEMLNTLEEISE